MEIVDVIPTQVRVFSSKNGLASSVQAAMSPLMTDLKGLVVFLVAGKIRGDGFCGNVENGKALLQALIQLEFARILVFQLRPFEKGFDIFAQATR